MNRCTSWFAFLIFLLCSAGGLWAQVPNPDSGQRNITTAIISFELNFPGGSPSHFAITVDSLDRSSYRSDNDAEKDDPYMVEFTMSASVRSRIFELARQANYFKGDFDYTKSRIAFTGTKILSYVEGPTPGRLGAHVDGVRNRTTYNWSTDPAVQELTSTFQNISNTMEAGKRLAFLHRFDKLGLDAELKQMEEMSKSGNLAEIQAIAPVLQSIMDDSGVMRLARQRARHLLAGASHSTTASSTLQH